MPRNQHITRTKGVCGGEPCIAGTRIPTAAILEFANAGYSTGAIVEQYPNLRAAQVWAALCYERRLYRRLGRRVDSARQRLGRWLLDD